jgi:hypothetical protein
MRVIDRVSFFLIDDIDCCGRRKSFVMADGYRLVDRMLPEIPGHCSG